MAAVVDIRKMMQGYVDLIAETLLTDQQSFQLPEFHLDPFQEKLVTTNRPLVRILAPAGSGKTRTLTAKALDILNQDPNTRVLCLTFTKAAASEFQQRITKMNAAFGGKVVVSTVNGFGWDVLKQACPSAKLVDPSRPLGAYGVIKKVLQKHKLATTGTNLYSDLLELVDLTKGLGFSHTDTVMEADTWYEQLRRLRLSSTLEISLSQIDLFKSATKATFLNDWYPLWTELSSDLYASDLFTLDDQKYWSQRYLSGDIGTQARLRKQGYTHIMVDEFQDINFLDLLLISQAASILDSALYIVGDDDQCIFEWRACTPLFIRHPDAFLKPLVDTKGSPFETILLERNYRCPRNIVIHSANLIENNLFREKKTLTPVRTDDANIRVIPVPSAYLSLHIITELISSIATQYPDHSVALLGRKKCQLIPLHILFTKHKIPFYIDRDLNVFLSKTFQDFRSMMALPPVYQKPLGKNILVSNLLTMADKYYKQPLNREERDAITRYLHEWNILTLFDAVQAFEKYTGPIKRGYGKVEDVCAGMRSFLTALTVVEALQSASEHFKGFQQDFIKSRTDIFFADPPFSHLTDLAIGYDSNFDGFLNDIDLAIEDAENHSGKRKKIELMTGLRAKGREFDTVIILDANNGIWPHSRAIQEGHIEAERRLFYVAISRTKNNLLFFVNERIQGMRFEISPFIEEMKLPPEAWLEDKQSQDISRYLADTLKL